ncbi:MAG TPA: HlyD family efflux transporter periplasmic adaptor subunit, partial [Bryobacteraceae bacterium]|nr:HlyD family efflux transporter periplasmic adaptor subunit [Bryobacteraceae bacterium]
VNINAPELRGPENNNLILMKLVKPGAVVKKGEIIAQVDAQSTKDHIDDVTETVRQARADVDKRKAEQAIEWETLQQTIRQSKSDMEKARLDAKEAPILTPIEKELLQLSVDETEARYKQLQQNLAFQKASFAAELRILEITRERQERHLARHTHDIQKFTVAAPMDGIAVMQQVWRGGDMGQIQEGDQVYPGQLFMKVVDSKSLQLEATINQAESSELRIGQKVTVRLDAFPDLQLPGTVYSIGALATGSWGQNYYIRTVPVVIHIEASDNRLIPDLSGSGDVVVAQAENVLTVPRAAVRNGNTVLVRSGGRFVEKTVTTGIQSEMYTSITDGLNAGDEVAEVFLPSSM